MKTSKAILEEAHKHSLKHREEILNSEMCGCFHCEAIFNPSEIKEWVDADKNNLGQTALCPKCGIDSVIGSSSGYPIAKEFLGKMQKHWF
ncbi:MAG: cytoplasmic protein [Candidatus Omnitrophica bacterium]|nr:cytoplasmic protein [Candidatus Omnitrophota bacterium]